MVREPKYALLLKHAARMAQAGGYLEPGDLPPARLVFGSFLPQDRKAAIDEVVALLQAKGISRLTALRLLVAVGVEIGEVAEELDQIQAEDFQGAAQLLDALGDEEAVADYLGRKIENPNPSAPPEIDLPEPRL